MAELSRRNALLLAGRLTGAAALGGLAVRGGYLALGGPEAAASTRVLDRELRIGYLPITDASALLTAHARGFLADAGLPSAQPVLFRSWESLAQAFLVGEVDVVHLLLPFAVQLKLAKEAPLKVVAWGHTNGSALTVATDVTETAQLEGRRVAVPYWWSIHSILTQRLLVGAGLRPVIGRRPRAGEVELVVMAPAEMVSALASGAVAGYAVADPFNAVAEVRGIGRIHRFLGDVWADHACCGIAVRQDLIDAHPAAVAALASGIVGAQAWLDANRTAAGPLLADGFLPQPEPAIAKVFTRTPAPYADVTRHAGWGGETLGFSAFPHAGYTAELVRLMATTTVDGDRAFLAGLDPASVHRRLVDDSFVTAALARAGRPVPPRQELIQP